MQLIVQLGLLRSETTQCTILFSSDMKLENSIKQFLEPVGHRLQELCKEILEIGVGPDLHNLWREGRAFSSRNM